MGKWNKEDIFPRAGAPFSAPAQPSTTAPKTPVPTKLSPDDYHALAAERGFQWLGPYTSSQLPTRWHCLQCGTEWKACYSSIRRKKRHLGCPGCYARRRGAHRKLGPQAYTDLGVRTGWIHDDAVPPTTHHKSYWLCPGRVQEDGNPVRHRQKKSFHALQQGDGCRECSPVRPLRSGHYRALASRRGWKWLGRGAKNNRTKTRWRCEASHEISASYDNVQAGMGCRRCHPRAQKLPDDYRALAEVAGLVWEGPEVSKVVEATGWRCLAVGHRFSNTYHNVSRNARGGLGGCPECESYVNGARVSRPQMQLAERVGGEVNVAIGRYKVDVLVHRAGATIAIEYDAYYWHAHLEKQDARKTRALAKEGLRVLRIRSNQLVPEVGELEEWLRELARSDAPVRIVTLPDWGVGPTFAESVRRT